MPHPRKRTWTLGTLDPSNVYGLWLDSTTDRWEVVVLDTIPLEVARPMLGLRYARSEDELGPIDWPEDVLPNLRIVWT